MKPPAKSITEIPVTWKGHFYANGQTDTKMLIITFHNFKNTPVNWQTCYERKEITAYVRIRGQRCERNVP